MNWKKAWIPALVVAPFLILLASRFGHDPHALPSVLVGKAAPPFVLTKLDGTPLDSQSLRGKPAVLNFWSTWCVPCKIEHEVLQEGARIYGDRVQFLGVVYQDTAEAARAYLRTVTNRYPHVVDPKGQVAIEHGVSGVPESYFVNAEGTIVHKQVGVVTPDILHSQLGAMLQGGAR